MTLLAIDTTGSACSAAIVDHEKVAAEVFTNVKRNHSVMLMPMIDEIFSKCGLSISNVDYIAITSGPGSFTGLRIGAATAKSLAHAASKKIIAVPTLDALAYNAYEGSSITVPIMDARRRQVYTAFFRRDSGLPMPVTDYMAEDISRVISMLDEYRESAVFLGDAVNIYADIIKSAGHKIAPVTMNAVRASSVGALALGLLAQSKAEPLEYSKLMPFYLRLPQAERELNSKRHASGI